MHRLNKIINLARRSGNKEEKRSFVIIGIIFVLICSAISGVKGFFL
jgi:hypothetical protein